MHLHSFSIWDCIVGPVLANFDWPFGWFYYTDLATLCLDSRTKQIQSHLDSVQSFTSSYLHHWTGCAVTLLAGCHRRPVDCKVVKASAHRVGEEARTVWSYTFHCLASGVHSLSQVIGRVVVGSPGEDYDVTTAFPVQHEIGRRARNCQCVWLETEGTTLG